MESPDQLSGLVELGAGIFFPPWGQY